jgi:membrane-bound metal-dependent hydrolase YbcI (DUF457 family)
MLPPGHLAGGFLAGKLASLWIPQLNQSEYLVMATLFGILPDLDFFLVFYKKGKFIADDKIDHHDFPSHAPLLYIAVFVLWILLFPNSEFAAVAFILGTLSHFVIDTFTTEGILWLYPFSGKKFRLNHDPKIPHPNLQFIAFWKDFLKQYIKLNSFKLEAAITIVAILTLIFSK